MSRTIDAYDAWPEAYDADTAEFWQEFPEQPVKEFLSLLKSPRVLDLGSGPGRDAELLARNGCEVTCVDASKRMIEMTEAKGFRSIQADFRDLSFVDRPYGGAWAYTSLIHLRKSEVPATLEGIRESLLEGAPLLMGFITGDGEGYETRKTMPDTKRWFAYYDEEGMRLLAEAAGFRLVHTSAYQPRRRTYINQIYVQADRVVG